MKLLYLFNKDPISPDFATSLILAGHEVDIIDNYECSYEIDNEACRNKILETIRNSKEPYDYLISHNYIPSAAYVCDSLNLIYISWMYDAWQPTLYSESARLPCNRIFVFDSEEYAYMKRLGRKHVYLLPLAVNRDRLCQLEMTEEDALRYGCDVSFVGSLYGSESINGYNLMRKYLEKDMREEMDGRIANATGNWKADNDWLTQMKQTDYSKFPALDTADKRDNCLLPDDIYYITNAFARTITQKDRVGICNRLAKQFDTRLYTFEDPVGLAPEVDVRPGISYTDEMPKVFYYSKINLNITLRSIFAGIPLRAFDIMGCGGFLMMNKQKDMDNYFIDGVDYVSFDCVEDLVDKAAYYLNHEKERIQILVHGYRTVNQYHTYQHRIHDIFEMIQET